MNDWSMDKGDISPGMESVTCRIYPRAEHNLSRKMVNPSALKVLYRLRDEGYQAYLVGGCVRDLLLGREPRISM